MKKLIKHKVKSLAEIFQSLEVKFSLVREEDKDTVKQITYPAKCRDFLGDCIWSKKTGNDVYIYCFSYSYKDTPFQEDKLLLSLLFPTEESMNCFKKNFHHLTEKEEKYNIGKSVFHESSEKHTLIVEADKIWQDAVWKMSLYTFYLKILSYDTVENAKEPENRYIEALSPEKEDKFLKAVTRVTEEILHGDMMSAHEYSGFYSIMRGKNTQMASLIGV